MNDEQQIIEPVPTMAGYKKIPTFKLWIANQFPYIETDFDAITNYELLQAVIKYLNTIIENENNVESNVTALYNAFVNLHDYVENFFDNLDVQEEIDNKLDEMVEDGTLENILLNYTQITKVFDTYNDMMLDTSTYVNGMKLKTLGYHYINDGGGAEYIVTNVQSDTKYQISIGTNLWIELIINDNTLNIKQLGAFGDDTNDDTQIFKTAIQFIKNNSGKLFINKGIYKITEKLIVDWNSENFNQNFVRSFEIFGAGQLQSKLHFTTNNGLDINPNNNALVLKIHDFCVENSDYNNLEDTGETRTPVIEKGIGLKVRHIGYMGRVSNISVRGFYIGIMTLHCYGGPILENLFVKNAVFGYYSQNDTTIVHNSNSFVGCECSYLQDGSISTLTNVICEENINMFLHDNTYNQRYKFSGRGFAFINNALVTSNGCYCEDLYGNAIYIENSNLIDNNSSFNNLMNFHLTTQDYAELKNWLDNNPGHNYDDFYIINNYPTRNHVSFNCGSIVSTSSAYVAVKNNPNDADFRPYSNKICFYMPHMTGTWKNNFERFYKGPTKPIVSLNLSVESNESNIGFLPEKLLGIPLFNSNYLPSNGKGPIILSCSRNGNFTDTNYNEVKLKVFHNLDGSIRIYKETLLDNTSVNDIEVMRIAADGKVTFPQN